MARKQSGPIRIISDGHGRATVVMDGNDTEIENVTSVSIWIEPGGLTRADLEIMGVVVDTKAYPKTVTMTCPLCNHTEDHTCEPDTIGGL